MVSVQALQKLQPSFVLYDFPSTAMVMLPPSTSVIQKKLGRLSAFDVDAIHIIRFRLFFNIIPR